MNDALYQNMAQENMVYYYRKDIMNRLQEWRLDDDGLYTQWIRAYFRQPVRDRPVTVIGEDGDGDEVTYECIAETNDKISGTMNGGRRIEIVWCHEGMEEETLARYP